MIGEVERLLEREAAARGGAEASCEHCMGRPAGAAKEGAFARKKDSDLGGGRAAAAVPPAVRSVTPKFALVYIPSS